MSYIYFIQADDGGPIKIGTTQFNPTRRMVKMQTDCPWPIKLLGCIKGTASQEKQIHLLLARYRTSGEWFAPHPIVLAAVAEAIRVGKPAPFAPAHRKYEAKYDHPLCKYRAANKLSLENISELTGISRGQLSRIESGQNLPKTNSLKALVMATGLSAVELRPDLARIMAEVA